MYFKEAIAILKKHNEWRRGADIPMEDPKIIGEAIDCVAEQSLSWQDVKKIVEIADDMLHSAHNRVEWEDKSEEEYYTEVLRRFMEEE